MALEEIALWTLVGLLPFALLFLFSAGRVRPGERLLILFRERREGDLMTQRARFIGPGLFFWPPFLYRRVRIDLPLGLFGETGGPGGSGDARRSTEDEVPGYPGITLVEVCLRAARGALILNPKTKRTTTEEFHSALRQAVEAHRHRGES